MSRNTKRKLEAFDPLASDPEDDDFSDTQPASRPQRRGKSKKTSSAKRKPVKRRRETYGDSDDDIEADSDEISEEEASYSEASDEPIERNPRTGRSVRSVAKKQVKYEEPSDEEIEAEDTDGDPIQPTPAARGKRRTPAAAVAARQQSLIVRLEVPSWKMEGHTVTRPTRSRTGSKGVAKHEPSSRANSAVGTRRSSRISHDEENPLVALTDSGRHETVTRAGTQTPDPQQPPSGRPTRSGKGLKKPPISAIMEASQETSNGTQSGVLRGDDLLSQLQDPATRGEDKPQVERTSPEIEREDIQMEEVEDEQIVQESQDDHDEDQGPVARGSRLLRHRRKASTPPMSQPLQPKRRSMRSRKSEMEQTSDFEPDAEGEPDAEEDVSSSDDLLKPTRGGSSNGESQAGRRSGRLARKTASQRSRSRRNRSEDEADEELDAEEIADEAADLEDDDRRRKRERPRRRPASRSEGITFEPNLRNRGNRPDYRIFRPELVQTLEEDDAPAVTTTTPQRNRRGGGGGGGGGYRSLFSTYGPFGGAGGPPPVFGGPAGPGATGGVDSDSSDDEMGGTRGGQQGIGGTVGMTPTSVMPKPYVPQTLNSDPVQGPGGGGPAGLGKVKDRKALADADPLGVDPNVSFDGVGGLDDHIDRLKEMVALPLLYPEAFQQFNMTPPRGVLFHGPPGTGKTLLARALASSVSSYGKKVTFYMRKGADALSKWVGEAEKQLRLLFEEARKNQPSIIFFDEIDGLAPVRSSKQEQIHASIVATLLALMDGMDGRGQVIVIGATNRPDSVDPALRRPGRFDREFYFPLPNVQARRAIIDIHTNGWDPPLKSAFKDELAEITRGYGGADLRALCTEAALNAVQGTYPQIYKSDKKLVIDTSKIKVLAKDFMISVNKIVPSSERSASSGASPLKKDVEPLLRQALIEVSQRVDDAVPTKRKATALEEAMYDDREDEQGFEREQMQRHFEFARVYRPRLLIHGKPGMGQRYLGAALLAKFEGLHVQSFDMATLMKDSTRSVEAAIVQLFEEVKRHKPSVIYLPEVDVWYRNLSDTALRTFCGLLQGLPPTDPVLVLGVMNREPHEKNDTDRRMLAELFGFSQKNQYPVHRPGESGRMEYFNQVIDLIRKKPADFPEAGQRKRRKLAELPVAQMEEPPKGPSKAQQKAQVKKDRQTLNMLKLHIQPVMEQIKKQYRKFRAPIIDDNVIQYLYQEQDPNIVSTDLTEQQRQQQQMYRPYEIAKDDKGVSGLKETASGKFYYNLEIVTIESRLSNGYYKRPKDFLADIKRLAKDAKTSGDYERTLKANEMLANVEVDMGTLEAQQPHLVAECEAVMAREQQRAERQQQKLQEAQQQGQEVPKMIMPNVPPANASKTTTETSGPVVLGQEVPGRPQLFPLAPSRLPGPSLASNQWSTTNGSHPSEHTNGSNVPSRPQEDSEMLDSQAEEHERPQQQQQQQQQPPAAAMWQTPSQQNTQGQRSQKGAHTQIVHGSQLDQYHNSASTTTSGQKTSDKSRSSGPYSVHTQQSNGVRSHQPEFPAMDPAGSQLPDTQEQHVFSSQSQESQSSQQMPPPPSVQRHSMPMSAILNNDNDTDAAKTDTALPSAASHYFLEDTALDRLHEQLTTNSSGMSVEQLEQINASLMAVIWDRRGEGNRNKIIGAVQDAFNQTVADIDLCQKILGPSQEDLQ
ncbi:AAA-domain-containing protein [Teratosphaeria nubilosa]|uniref:AAA-domain-containing protein n=1 Tax=Teratosphaeria nubilosa TaxID=161662 RepID=A0A6G1KW94_9PEZI|nr:AAA-domain-containing protein [Teratosphaeria nubilosa]